LRIGNIKLDVPFMQAALAGYSDLAMRNLARRFGAPLTFGGVMLDTSAAHPVVARKLGFTAARDLHPIGGQIVGTDPAMMVKAAHQLVNLGYDIIDLNFACPAPKVLRRGRGGSMLTDPNGVIEIFRRVRQEIRIPVTMKLRAGYDDTEASREDFWKIIDTVASEGIDAFVIHGRTVCQYYRGKANWDIVRQVKQKYPSITVIGSGDIFKPEDIKLRLDEAGIDGIAIARGAIGNPWIFQQAGAVLSGNPVRLPDVEEQGQIIQAHFNDVVELHGKRKAIGYFRKFAAQYAKHHPEKKYVHRELMAANSIDEVNQAIKKWYN
jgi:tRNA-dihydrouridine synthase B